MGRPPTKTAGSSDRPPVRQLAAISRYTTLQPSLQGSSPGTQRYEYLYHINCNIPSFHLSTILILYCIIYLIPHAFHGPPLWSSGEGSWLQIQRYRIRFPARPHFLRNSESRTASSQSREYNSGATWKKQQRLRSRKSRIWQ
jgi:hypothetical protein